MSKLIRDVIQKEKEEQRRFIHYVNLKNLNGTTIPKYRFTDTTDHYDVSMISGNTPMVVEIKVRKDKPIEYFLNNGAFLELKKLEYIQNCIEDIKIKHPGKYDNLQKYYFNFCSDGIIIYELGNPWDYNFNWVYLPKNNTNKNNKIWKLVHSLMYPVEIIKY
jgi:hypothetical protein